MVIDQPGQLSIDELSDRRYVVKWSQPLDDILDRLQFEDAILLIRKESCVLNSDRGLAREEREEVELVEGKGSLFSSLDVEHADHCGPTVQRHRHFR